MIEASRGHAGSSEPLAEPGFLEQASRPSAASPESRVVVGFRLRGRAPAAAALDAIRHRAQALGGRLCAWGPRTAAFDFDPESPDDWRELLTVEGLASPVSAGVAAGPLAVVGAPAPGVALGAGAALEHAARLARHACPGEALIDHALGQGLPAGLLPRGLVRRGAGAGSPWAASAVPLGPGAAPAPLRALAEPAFRRPAELPPRGVIGPLLVLRAAPGGGGTRALAALADEAGWALAVRPGVTGEPLGALRRALRRHAAARPAAEPGATLGALLDGEGVEIDAAAELLGDLAAGHEGDALALVDDAGLVDADSLEALVLAARLGAFSLVLRLGPSEPLPAALDGVPTDEASLPTWSVEALAGLPGGWLGPGVDAAFAQRCARRLDGTPLALREGLALGLSTGALRREEGGALTLLDPRAAFARGTAARLVARRLAALAPAERRVVQVLALLGGDVEPDLLLATLEWLGEEGDAEAALAALAAGGWLVRDGSGVALSTRTALHAALQALDASARGALHTAAVRALGATGAPLTAAAAALHAALGEDAPRAAALARRAAAAAIAAGLGASADALEAVPEQGPAALRARGLAGAWQGGEAWSPPEAPTGARRLSALPELAPPAQPAPEVAPPAPATPPTVPPPSRARHVGEGPRSVPASGAPRRAESPALAERNTALSALGRGDTPAALRLLRAGRERAAGQGAAAQSRAALAHAVGLGAAGRVTEALLEALEALARAREAADVRGERACARFLAHLGTASGQPEAAAAWEQLGA